ncbi:MAG TPA: vWA domain-containing protein, partial [Planctomycetota bacterium]|nr:vWA domain-containing protein [Planctomycetota bacterium]
MRRAGTTAILLAMLILGSTSLRADELILKDGRKFTGEIVRETEQAVSIKTVGGVLEFRRDEIIRVVWKADPRKLYRQKAKALSDKAVSARLELARWCLAQGLEAQARREVEQVLLLDPENTTAQEMLERLAKGTGGGTATLRVEITLTDGSQVKGRLVNSQFSLETSYGVLHIPTSKITAVVMGDDKTPDAVETARFKAKGLLTEELFVVDSKLGRLTIAKKDVRELSIYKPSAEEIAEAGFNDAMRHCNHFGLDVVLVIDCTDSMTGILLRLRQQSDKLCGVVRKFVPNTHFGVVSYRDHKVFDPDEFAYVTKLFPLTGNLEEFQDAVRGLRAKGGGDIPEAVFEGISEAMTHGGWRPNSQRVIILIGDAPPHPQQNGLKKTLNLVGDWRTNA